MKNKPITKLIVRKSYEIGQCEMELACERVEKELGYTFAEIKKHRRWAYEAWFTAPDGADVSGVIIGVLTEDKYTPGEFYYEADVLFGAGQMVGSNGDHVVEEDEYYYELGIGE